MQPKEIQETLKPFYDKFQELSQSGQIEEGLKYYHSHAVVVEKGKRAVYGQDKIREMFEHYWNMLGPHKFSVHNEVYQGTDDYLIASGDFEIHSEKGNHKGKMTHIWTKENGKWVIYHDEFEMDCA